MNKNINKFSLIEKFNILKRIKKNYVDEFVRLGNIHGDFFTLDFYIKRIHIYSNADFAKFVFNSHKKKKKKTTGYKELMPIFGDGLLTTNDFTAKTRRQVIGNLFSKTSTHKSIDSIKKNIEYLVDDLPLNQGDVDIYKYLSILTLQQISLLIFNHRMDKNECELFLTNTDHLQSWVIKKVMSPFKFLFSLPSQENAKAKRNIEYLNGFIADLERDMNTSLPILQHLKNHYKDDQNLAQILRDEAITFLIAGSETTSILLSTCLYELAKNQKLLSAAQNEAKAYLTNEKSFEDLIFIKAALNETMRLYNPAPQIARTVVKDIDWNGHHLKAGDEVRLIMNSLHRNPNYWQNPNLFDPNRFINSNIVSFSFLPFGTGARACIGKDLSIVIATTFLSKMLTRFDFSSTRGFELSFQPSITYRPEHGVFVNVK